MSPEFVMAYLPRRMQELGVGENYTIEYKDVTVAKVSKIKIEAANMFFFLVGGFSQEVIIVSESGAYSPKDDGINEQQHQHTGTIEIENKGGVTLHLEFIVAIIKNK